MTETPFEHGTVNGYTNRGCRCEACREALRRHYREKRAQWKAEGRCVNCTAPATHGTRCARHAEKVRDGQRRRYALRRQQRAA
jgi:hypothetical protein